MKKECIYPLMGALAAVAVLSPPQSLAATPQYSQRAAAVVPDKAPAALCQRYILGGRQIRKTTPVGTGGILAGLPPAGSTDTAQVSYTITDGNKLSFSSNTYINMAIVKAPSNDTSVIYYAGPGQKQDTGLTAPLTAANALQPVREFSLCYGLPETQGVPATNVDFSLVIPRCDFGAGPEPAACASLVGSELTILKSIALRSTDGSVLPHQEFVGATCFCSGPDLSNIDALVQCDDSAPAAALPPSGEVPILTEAGAPCTVASTPYKPEEFVEVSNNPYFCRTLNGQRMCWLY